MRILSPNGKVVVSNKIEPVVEKAFKLNGKQQRVAEVAEGFKNNPNAILVHVGAEMMYEQLYIGNLKPEKVQEIMETLLRDGKYDFSKLQYQETKKMDKLLFDDGESLPYSSETTPFSTPVGLPQHGFINFGNACIQAVGAFDTNEDDEECGDVDSKDADWD